MYKDGDRISRLEKIREGAIDQADPDELELETAFIHSVLDTLDVFRDAILERSEDLRVTIENRPDWIGEEDDSDFGSDSHAEGHGSYDPNDPKYLFPRLESKFQ